MMTYLTVPFPSVALAAALAATERDGSRAAAIRRTVDHVRVAGPGVRAGSGNEGAASRDVRVDVYEGESVGRAVLLLHGVGGLLGDGALMRRAARIFAASGFKACVVHYFNATGTLFSTASGIGQHAPMWKAAIEGAARHYAGPAGVGFFGYSLGGALAAGVASELPVAAVVVMAGSGLAECGIEAASHPAPLLVLHGGKDPASAAEGLIERASREGRTVEDVLYPGEGHAFGASAERDALQRSVDFFRRCLGAGGD